MRLRQPTPDAGTTPAPGMIEPGSQLPANPLGQGGLVERIEAPPDPGTDLAVGGLSFDLHPVRGGPPGGWIGEKPMGQGAGVESRLFHVLERRRELLLHG